jgi:hypothetical protein
MLFSIITSSNSIVYGFAYKALQTIARWVQVNQNFYIEKQDGRQNKRVMHLGSTIGVLAPQPSPGRRL